MTKDRPRGHAALETGRSAEEALDPIAAKEVADLWGFIEHFAFGPRAEAPMAAAEG